MEEKIARMRELIPVLQKASRAYYAQDTEIMSNFEYDRLYDELQALEAETGIVLSGSPSVTVGYEAVDALPKERHEKRRLTSDRFLPLYAQVLAPQGFLRFKTDNESLFRYSEESLVKAGWTIRARTEDLHAAGEPLAAGNVRTEYETNFLEAGKRICCLEATPVRPA